jgi:hypothetical protein
MILKLLPILPLFAAGAACAQINTQFGTNEPRYATAALPTTGDRISEIPFVPYQTTNGVDHVCFASNLGIGYNTGTATYGTHSATASGMRYQGGLGVAFPVNTRSSAQNFFLATLDLISIQAQDNIKNDVPTATNNDYSLLYVGIPFSFNHVIYSRSGRANGFYYQLGSYFCVNAEAKNAGKDIKSAVNKAAIEPFAGFGFATIFNSTNRFTGNEHQINLFVGPFVSYNAVSVLSTSGNTFRYLSFGITCSTIRLD